MPKPVQRPCPPFFIGGGGPKILALAAREAQIVGINANLRSGDGHSQDAAQSLMPAATDQKLAWLREAAGDALRRPRDPDASSGSCTSPTTRAAIVEGDREGAFGCQRRRRAARAGDARRKSSTGSSTCSNNGASAGRCRTSWCRTTRSRQFAPIVARLDGK